MLLNNRRCQAEIRRHIDPDAPMLCPCGPISAAVAAHIRLGSPWWILIFVSTCPQGVNDVQDLLYSPPCSPRHGCRRAGVSCRRRMENFQKQRRGASPFARHRPSPSVTDAELPIFPVFFAPPHSIHRADEGWKWHKWHKVAEVAERGVT